MKKDHFLKSYKGHFRAIHDTLGTDTTWHTKRLMYMLTIIHIIDTQRDWFRPHIEDPMLISFFKAHHETFLLSDINTLIGQFSAHTSRMWGKYTIPFLNLPMFGIIDLPDTNIPTSLFINEHKSGFLDFLQSVPFEFVDNKSLDDVITLEILGFLFENMLEDRKGKAAFYTPIEIVNYMCAESIIQSVITKLEPRYSVYEVDKDGNTKKVSSDVIIKIDDTYINKADIDALIRHPHAIQNLTHEQLTHILKILMSNRINDPAVGSGAFPIGMLQLLTNVSACILDELRQDYKLSELKRNFIRYCLTGVDIDANAIEVCRLRMGLSILSDMDEPAPLPNMHFRFVVGNSLIPLQNGRIIEFEWLDDSKNSFFEHDTKYLEELKEYAHAKDGFFESFDNIQLEYDNYIFFRNYIVENYIPHKLGDRVESSAGISFDWKVDFPEIFFKFK